MPRLLGEKKASATFGRGGEKKGCPPQTLNEKFFRMPRSKKEGNNVVLRKKQGDSKGFFFYGLFTKKGRRGQQGVYQSTEEKKTPLGFLRKKGKTKKKRKVKKEGPFDCKPAKMGDTEKIGEKGKEPPPKNRGTKATLKERKTDSRAGLSIQKRKRKVKGKDNGNSI